VNFKIYCTKYLKHLISRLIRGMLFKTCDFKIYSRHVIRVYLTRWLTLAEIMAVLLRSSRISSSDLSRFGWHFRGRVEFWDQTCQDSGGSSMVESDFRLGSVGIQGSVSLVRSKFELRLPNICLDLTLVSQLKWVF
jgi:hypothetical protein